MPTRQLKLPQSIVVSVTLTLFALGLFAARQFTLLGDPRDLSLAIAAAMICLLFVAGLIHANYTTYIQSPDQSRQLNGNG